MKNFKQLALGLLVGALAISFSAFTTNHNTLSAKKVKLHRDGMITENFIAQPSLDSFQPQSGTPSVNDCQETSDRNCLYQVVNDGHDNIPEQSSYTKTEIDGYVTNSWLAPVTGSAEALYEP